MLYITLRGRRCDIIFLNVYVQTEDKSDDMKNSFYEEMERAFDQFPLITTCKFPVRIFQCKSRDRRYFDTNNWE